MGFRPYKVEMDFTPVTWYVHAFDEEDAIDAALIELQLQIEHEGINSVAKVHVEEGESSVPD